MYVYDIQQVTGVRSICSEKLKKMEQRKLVNSSPTGQNGRHFADDIFRLFSSKVEKINVHSSQTGNFAFRTSRIWDF